MPHSREMECRSSAFTLSDMEIFIFPELLYSLVLANILSPRLWRWRHDPWFAGVERMTPYRRILRLKQYIMDHYAFNLDLDTWGLTTQERELSRFSGLVDRPTLAQSNALFGYEGDRYYFDLDIRTHFGLDKYDGNVIPYWKTETVEAMDAFRFKPGYETGAGECVSLSCLYAAALFVVAGIPLRDLFLMATPLHSQNFVDVGEGILTNNRRLVTRAMWVNGTALSAQARRALENERVTVVSHETGYIHILYPRATISRQAYQRFSGRLRHFLRHDLTPEILGNFLRHDTEARHCFQIRWPLHGRDHYVAAERAFAYEQKGSYRVTDATRPRLMAEMETEEFAAQPLPGRIVLNDLEEYVRSQKPNLSDPASVERLQKQFVSDCIRAETAMAKLMKFCRVEPRLPDPAAKSFEGSGESLGLDPTMTRETVRSVLLERRADHPTVDLAWYAYRDLNLVDAAPFLVAALERSPVSIVATRELSWEEAVRKVEALPNESIYDEDGRLAQPDEVWNYGRGDGAEKCVLLANLWLSRFPDDEITLEWGPDWAALRAGGTTYRFPSSKRLRPQTRRWPLPG